MLTATGTRPHRIAQEAYVCLSCRLHAQQTQHGKRRKSSYIRPVSRQNGIQPQESIRPPEVAARTVRPRYLHTSARRLQQVEAARADLGPPPPPPRYTLHESPTGIRSQLRLWQEEHGKALEAMFKDNPPGEPDITQDGDMSALTRLSDNNITSAQSTADLEQESAMHFAQQADDFEGDMVDPRFLRMGDLVEIEYSQSEKENTLAVFVRRIADTGQFYTMQGRWIHANEAFIQYSIPGYISPRLVEPVIAYLPNEDQLEDMEALKMDAFVNDLNVPRDVAAPLVTKMVQFHRESLEIYRKHASALDNAHNLLANQSDLRYGSLTSAASTLLKTPADKLSIAALFTVRQALQHAGFGFNFDRDSHRLTGFLQIRSIDQVKSLEEVRGWLRTWQEDQAATASMTDKQRARHKVPRDARIVYSFIEKAREIILQSRETREPTRYGSIGPSKVQRDIDDKQQSVSIRTHKMFTDEEVDIVRFLESWAVNAMFAFLPRVKALPPLLMQAVGCYEGYDLNSMNGFLFLQELGTIMPYENRIVFDPHLLLPTSQHSRPLQNLMTTIVELQSKPGFKDSMADLRRDHQLPVYCIDAASAHEIDDGLSIERANHADAESPEWWVHIHIANPTAFFSRDHPLAKMARHMGESIYMPERAYMMMPRWATQRYFSLGTNKPCLTFSARMNANGDVLEKKIRPSTLRNVTRLTPDETNQLLGIKPENLEQEIILTVGGVVPPSPPRDSPIDRMRPSDIANLKALQQLAEKRQLFRKNNGGAFYDMFKPDINVWQSHKSTGLAWTNPFRLGSRVVEGDPLIQLRTRPLTNWFRPKDFVANILVQEMMLLACELSTSWCAERQIPTIYRGSLAKPEGRDSAEFYETVCKPAIAKDPNGELPLHLGVEYLRTMGRVNLSTRPLKHQLLGLDHYGKVTSPLRRYGDMILHWQIEAALREEARTGRSLVAADKKADRGFLPFSEPVLKSIMVGLHPREQMIMRAKGNAERFWIAMLLFRLHHFRPASSLLADPDLKGSLAIPFSGPQLSGTTPDGSPINLEKLHFYVPQFNKAKSGGIGGTASGLLTEVNLQACMVLPTKGSGLGEVERGDLWEVRLGWVDVYRRTVYVKPVGKVSGYQG